MNGRKNPRAAKLKVYLKFYCLWHNSSSPNSSANLDPQRTTAQDAISPVQCMQAGIFPSLSTGEQQASSSDFNYRWSVHTCWFPCWEPLFSLFTSSKTSLLYFSFTYAINLLSWWEGGTSGVKENLHFPDHRELLLTTALIPCAYHCLFHKAFTLTSTHFICIFLSSPRQCMW